MNTLKVKIKFFLYKLNYWINPFFRYKTGVRFNAVEKECASRADKHSLDEIRSNIIDKMKSLMILDKDGKMRSKKYNIIHEDLFKWIVAYGKHQNIDVTKDIMHSEFIQSCMDEVENQLTNIKRPA